MKNKDTVSQVKLKHIDGNVGFFVKEYYATGFGLMRQIKLDDGRIFYAPAFEFKEV